MSPGVDAQVSRMHGATARPSAMAIVLLALLASIIFAVGVALFGAQFAKWANSGVAFAGSAAVVAFAVQMLRQDFAERRLSIATLLKLVALGAIFLVVLTRGAPHNNSLLSTVYAQLGAPALAALTAGVLAAGVIVAAVFGRDWDSRSIDSRLEQSWAAVLVLLALGAALGAAQPILAAWDQPSWGDASVYDAYAHSIALGQLPAGGSGYMPVYQFGNGGLYWTFGHFFFVPQLANLAFAPVTAVLVALAAARFFGSPTAGLVAGLLAMSHDHLRYTPHMMTIENWYVPAMALTVYAAARYLDRPTGGHAALVALAAGLVFSIRLQGAFYCAFVLLVPLFAAGLPPAKRLGHMVVAGLVFAAVLTPWTIRNYVADGHLSPGTAARSARIMALTGDRRVFYGIRRVGNTDEINREWEEKYPDEEERLRAQAIFGWLRPIMDPKFVWFEAVPWRFLAFYGLLPPGVWDPDGVRPTDWSLEGAAYALQIGPVSMLLLASLIGLLFVRPRRVGLFLLGGIGANLVLIIWVGFSEPRMSYPVFPLHMVLAAAPFAIAAARKRGEKMPHGMPWRGALIGTAGVILLAAGIFAARAAWGERYALRPLTETLKIVPGLETDRTLPDVTCVVPAAVEAAGTGGSDEPNIEVRVRVTVTNNHFPVKYFGLWSNTEGVTMAGFPPFTTDPRRETYFLAVASEANCPEPPFEKPALELGVAFAGASADTELREGDLIEATGVVTAQAKNDSSRRMWIHAKKAHLLQRTGRGTY